MIEQQQFKAEQNAVRVPAPLDVAHLVRMTLGELSLEREVLQLFNRQAELLLARMRGAKPAAIIEAAHTLKGSARGIGAWDLAHVAQALEFAAATADRAAIADVLEALSEKVGVARAAIDERLRAH
jgi:HPt (histidine-containing phosphotransfer) domain-containing protein